jgi:formate/nitrite transporter FocA (FNT family)
MLLQADGVGASVPPVTVAGFAGNLLPVILGNIAGGSVLVGLVYHLIYGKPAGRVQR